MRHIVVVSCNVIDRRVRPIPNPFVDCPSTPPLPRIIHSIWSGGASSPKGTVVLVGALAWSCVIAYHCGERHTPVPSCAIVAVCLSIAHHTIQSVMSITP